MTAGNYWINQHKKKFHCNRCKSMVDENILKITDDLPPMAGIQFDDHPYPPVCRCVICKKPVCRSCMYGHGMFIFTCKEECKDKLLARLKRP